GAQILGRDGIKEAYATGRGRIKVRGKARIEQMANGRQRIIITELPYQVNKANLIQKIAELHRDKTIEGISDLRDESDRSGMRIETDPRRDADVREVRKRIARHCRSETTFGVRRRARVDGERRVLSRK